MRLPEGPVAAEVLHLQCCAPSVFERERLGHLEEQVVELCDNVLSRGFSAAIKLQREAKLEVQVPRGLSEFRELFGEVLNLVGSQFGLRDQYIGLGRGRWWRRSDW